MMDDPILPVELREEIISSFEHRLRTQGSPILDSVHAHEQMLGQARSLLDEVVSSYRETSHRETTEGIDPNPPSLRVEIGASQAIEEMHPADSLHAANLLFETALPVVQRAFSTGGWSDARTALLLNRVIMSWIASGAVSHTVFVLKTIRDSHRADMARLARDLHDRTAHAIGVAIQNLELHEVYASQDTVRAQEKLHRAREAMRQALGNVRQFSAKLRMTVRPEELEQTLTEYLAANTAGNVLTSVKVTGDIAILPQGVFEEVYFTLREAIRNALVHSDTTRLDVTIGVSESHLHVQVSDTGRGFSVEEAINARKGLGLLSMRERVALIGGELRLFSLLGHGTTVEIWVPLGRTTW